MFTIIGSGFGLYGYLPALLLDKECSVVLMVGMREKLQARAELSRFIPQIFWANSLEDALSQADGVVIAVPPRQQMQLVEAVLRHPNIQRLVLEKPLAPNPSTAQAILDLVIAAGVQVRVGYTLLYTSWWGAQQWPSKANGCTKVFVRWTFMAHHFLHELENWKRMHIEGGGVLRFFGVHLLAMLSAVGYTEVICSKMEGLHEAEPEAWDAIFSGYDLPNCHVHINSRYQHSEFKIVSFGNNGWSDIMHDIDPFSSEQRIDEQDKRITVLHKLLQSFDEDDAQHHTIVKCINQLWLQVEAFTDQLYLPN